MKTANKGNLTKRDLAARWGHEGVPLTIRQVERRIKKYQLLPCDWHGRDPEFHPGDVDGMEERRKAHLLAMRQPLSVITVQQAKKIAKAQTTKAKAGKGGAK